MKILTNIKKLKEAYKKALIEYEKADEAYNNALEAEREA